MTRSKNTRSGTGKIRLGLCCQFIRQPIKFQTTTATALLRLPRPVQLERLSRICLHNASALAEAVAYCADHDIGAFRVNSQILPLKTHPQAGYEIAELPNSEAIVTAFRESGAQARQRDIRLSFHPDQFVVLNSPGPEIHARALEEILYQTMVAEWIGADTINIHGGGAYGDKPDALRRLAQRIEELPPQVRSRLTLENDDKVFSVKDLLPICKDLQIPLVYDVHHHRCLVDGLSVQEATERALGTWDREPLFHLSSPLAGWSGPKPERHHDYINPADFPVEWLHRDLTIEIEAKAKELAVQKLMQDLGKVRPAGK